MAANAVERLAQAVGEAAGAAVELERPANPEHGDYANFANVSFSDYEFTLTFARIDHSVEEGDIPGVAVSRVNCSPRFLRELIDAAQDAYSKWEYREGVKNLPETPDR